MRNLICFCAIESMIPRHKKSPEKNSSQGITNYIELLWKMLRQLPQQRSRRLL